jgi:tetratricopeptide (TPR) repeat protein
MLNRTRDQAVRMGAPRAEAASDLIGGMLAYQFGDWAGADVLLQRAVTQYRELGSAAGVSLALERLGTLATARGDIERGWDKLLEAAEVGEHASMRSHCLTRAYAAMAANRLAAGDLDSAETCLTAGEKVAHDHGACVTCSAQLLPEAVRVRLARGETDAADVHATELDRLAVRCDTQVWAGGARQARARVLTAQERWSIAREMFHSARDAYHRAGWPYEAAQCSAGEAAALRALGMHMDAAPLLQRARAEGASLGAANVEN